MDARLPTLLHAIAGIVIGVADRPDRVTGELVRTFEVLVTTTTRELLVRWVPESWLGARRRLLRRKLRNFRTARRNVARWIAGRRSLTDSDELAATRIMGLLLEAEQA